MNENFKRLKDIIKKNTFKYSDEPIFSLASGKKSHFYFDCKKTTMDPEGASLIGEIIFDKIKDLKISGIGGLTLGADPIAAATMYTAWQKEGKRINQFVVRKKQKGYGEKKLIEGNIHKGETVVIVDDVVTTGGSTIQAIKQSEEFGLIVEMVVLLIDRQEYQGKDNISKETDAPVISLFTKLDFMNKSEQKKYHEVAYYGQNLAASP